MDKVTSEPGSEAVDRLIDGRNRDGHLMAIGIEKIVVMPGTQKQINGTSYADVAVNGTVKCGEDLVSIAFLNQERVVGVARQLRVDRHFAQNGKKAVIATFAGVVSNLEIGLDSTSVLTVGVKTAAGKTFKKQFSVNGKIRSGPADRKSGVHATRPVVVTVETAELDEHGVLLVRGWVLSETDVVIVNTKYGEQRLGQTLFGRPRHDVGSSHPGYRNAGKSGFEFKASIREDLLVSLDAVNIEVITADGTSYTKAARVSRAQGSSRGEKKFAGFCDVVTMSTTGRLRIEGWMLSNDNVPIRSIDVLVGGISVGKAEIGISRDDLQKAHPTNSCARNSGFKLHAKMKAAYANAREAVFKILDEAGNSGELVFELQQVDEPAKDDDVVQRRDAGQEFRVHIDAPSVSDGQFNETISGRFTISGWALSRNGVDSVSVYLGDDHLGDAYYGFRRGDIEAAFPEWPAALLSGFALSIPPRKLKNGEHVLRVVVTDKERHEYQTALQATILLDGDENSRWVPKTRTNPAEIDSHLNILESAGMLKPFLIVIPVSSQAATVERLTDTVRSLQRQPYPDWRCVFLIEESDRGKSLVTDIEGRFVETEPSRFEAVYYGPDACVSRAIGLNVDDGTARLSRQSFVAYLEPGAVLSSDAFFHVLLSQIGSETVDFFYGDEFRFDPVSAKAQPYFKSRWSPDLALATNYIGGFWVVRAGHFSDTPLVGRDINAGGYHIALKLTSNTYNIRHVPKLLHEFAHDLAQFHQRDKSALQEALRERGISAEIQDGVIPGTFRVNRAVSRAGKVSIIIPTIAARGLIARCIESIRSMSSYKDVEIVCLDNIRGDPGNKWKSWFRQSCDVVVEIDEPFNWSRFNNLGAAAASGDYLLFLNDDIEVISPDWLEVLLQNAQRQEVGVVGPQLLYPDRKVQHAGLFLAGPGKARHAFRFLAEDDGGYFGLALTQRNVIGVTGACLMVRREVFDSVGGFNEVHSVVNNDLDFCLRCQRAGKLVVYTPFARLIHHELVSRAKMDDEFDDTSFISEWRHVFDIGDPYFHHLLSRESDDIVVQEEPIREVYVGARLPNAKEIRNVLAIKLDHIGDFVTALPALRRIKERFVNASLTVLVSPASAKLARMEPAIDSVVTFEFFHARSGLGVKKTSEVELLELENTLRAFNFDVAFDLRKHVDTRHVLLHTGAKYVVGFDSRNAFTWLDVAVEWEGDPLYVDKRQHVALDLLNLIDAASNATARDISVAANFQPTALSAFPAEFVRRFGDLYTRPVVCIHPASGNELRQWPAHHFARLIDMLVTRYPVNIAILGGADEARLVTEVFEAVSEKSRVWPLAGVVPISLLPDMIASAALFIGNNSGPKHIAAAVGVPTVSVHSAVVSSEEWGPLGRNSVAIRRDMSCGPCYIANASDCHRQIACLKGISPENVFQVCVRFLSLRTGIFQ